MTWPPRWLAAGMAALYAPAGPRVGQPLSLEGRYALWFHKPEDMRYAALYQRIGPDLPHLWTRMMTLGPAPELCLMTDEPTYAGALTGTRI